MNDEKRNLPVFISTIVCITALVALAVLIIIRHNANTQQVQTSALPRKSVALEAQIRRAAENFGIDDKNIRAETDLEERRRTITIFFPKGKLVEEFVAQIFAITQNSEYRIKESKHISRGRNPKKRNYVEIVFENKKKPSEKMFCEIILTAQISSESARVAFLIKGIENLSKEKKDLLLSFDEPLNYILTPWQTTVKIDSVWADSSGGVKKAKEIRQTNDSVAPVFSKIFSPVLIEIPIEDLENPYAKRKYTIMQSDDRNRMDEKMKSLQKMYPLAVGFYSRTGNLVLDSKEISRTFLSTIKKRNVMFFDARTLKKSISREIADELSAKYDTVSIFVQEMNKNNVKIQRSREDWEEELKNICNKALKSKNSVIFIGADNNFVDALSKSLAQMQKNGIQFVPITELSQRRSK